MKKLIPLVVVLASACAGLQTKISPAPQPVSLGCAPTAYTRVLNAVSDALLKICFLSNGDVKWVDGGVVAHPAPAAAVSAPPPSTPPAKKRRHK